MPLVPPVVGFVLCALICEFRVYGILAYHGVIKFKTEQFGLYTSGPKAQGPKTQGPRPRVVLNYLSRRRSPGYSDCGLAPWCSSCRTCTAAPQGEASMQENINLMEIFIPGVGGHLQCHLPFIIKMMIKITKFSLIYK